MALPPLVTSDDFAAWVGESVDAARAEAVLSVASGLVRSAAGGTIWVDDSGNLAEVPDEIRGVVFQVAERKWRNPTGAISWTKGPFSEQYANTADSGLYLTDSERETCARYSVNKTRGLWALGVTRDGDYTDQYLPVDGGEMMPFLPAGY